MEDDTHTTPTHKTSEKLLIKQELILIKRHIRRLENAIQKNHDHQMAVLEAVREAFLANVERDELLRETMREAADPWDGC